MDLFGVSFKIWGNSILCISYRYELYNVYNIKRLCYIIFKICLHVTSQKVFYIACHNQGLNCAYFCCSRSLRTLVDIQVGILRSLCGMLPHIGNAHISHCNFFQMFRHHILENACSNYYMKWTYLPYLNLCKYKSQSDLHNYI